MLKFNSYQNAREGNCGQEKYFWLEYESFEMLGVTY